MLARFPEVTPAILDNAGRDHDVSRPIRQTLALLNILYGTDTPPDVVRAAREDTVMRYLISDTLTSITLPDPMDAARSPRRSAEVIRRLRYRITLVTGWRHRAFEIVRPIWRWLNI